MSLLYAPQRNKRFVNLCWDYSSQHKACSSRKKFLAKLKRPLTFGMRTSSSFWGINGFLSIKCWQQNLAPTHHTSISCCDDGDNDGDVIRDRSVIWEKTDFHSISRTAIKGLLFCLPVKNKHIKVERLVWFYRFIPITAYSCRSSHEFQKI